MDKLMEILKEVAPDIDFETEKALITDELLDSFTILNIISEISDEFDVDVPVEEIVPENFNSAESIYQMIQNLM